MMPDGGWDGFKRDLAERGVAVATVTSSDDLIIAIGTIKAMVAQPIRVFLRGDRLLRVELRERSQ